MKKHIDELLQRIQSLQEELEGACPKFCV